MSLLREAENSNGKVWPYDNLTPLESLSVGETIFLDLEIDCCKTSFAFTLYSNDFVWLELVLLFPPLSCR